MILNANENVFWFVQPGQISIYFPVKEYNLYYQLLEDVSNIAGFLHSLPFSEEHINFKVETTEETQDRLFAMVQEVLGEPISNTLKD